MKLHRLFAGTCIAALGALACAATVHAQSGQGWGFTTTFLADRDSADDVDEAGSAQLKLQTHFGAGIAAGKQFVTGSDQTTNLTFGLSTSNYPDNSDLSRIYLDFDSLTVQKLNGYINQLRFGVELRHAMNDDGSETIYDRARISGAFRFDPAPRQTVQFRLRLGYRDQNEAATFDGYDQSEVLADMMYLWASPDYVNRFAGWVYYEGRDADSDTFTYDEFGLRGVLRHKVNDDMQIWARGAAYNRQYDAGGREDNQLSGSIGIETRLSRSTTFQAYTGYESNNSNVAEKKYDGALLGATITTHF